jgi:hypothetical protein
MIPRILEQLDKGRQEFSWRELCYGLLPCATVMRWRARADAGEPLLEKPGPKKKEPLDLETVKNKIGELEHGRRRTAGTTALQAEWSDSISRRRFQELVAEERQNRIEDMKRIQWHVPGAAWSIDTTEYGPEKWKITLLRDLASKYQLPTPLVQPDELGVRIALYLDLMFKKEGAPMFLKRDLGSPLNCHAVDQVLERYCVLPLNSPPGYPRYNGSIERSMRDLQDALDRRRLSELQLPMSVQLELATHQLNHRRLRCLGHQTPCQVYHDPAQVNPTRQPRHEVCQRRLNAGTASRLRTLLMRRKARLPHTQHPNALPASWRCPGQPGAWFASVFHLSTPGSLSVMDATGPLCRF